jgi:hypothetical protein
MGGSLLHQDTQTFGASASLPAVSPTHAYDPATAAHALVADASGALESTGKQPNTGIGLASSGQTRPPAIPTIPGARRYVISMKSVPLASCAPAEHLSQRGAPGYLKAP